MVKKIESEELNIQEIQPATVKLAKASVGDVTPLFGLGAGFYMPSIDGISQVNGLLGEKLLVPKDYHSIVQMCYDFYQRGGIAAVVVNRLSELAITKVRNGQRKTSDGANAYYDAILHRAPSRLYRFLNSMALEYLLSGMVLPRVDWKTMRGEEISPQLSKNREYDVPVFDWYPPMLVEVEWAGWGERKYYLKVPSSDIKLIRSKAKKVKEQQTRYNYLFEYFPNYVSTVEAGANKVELLSVDPILRKPVSFSEYPTPFMINVLEALIYKQQLRRMDFAVASRVINSILMVQEGNDEYPAVEGDTSNVDNLRQQILNRGERVFEIFTNHTTKLTWVSPDVVALLDQEKYRQSNTEISEGLGFSQLLITGESRNAQASELSTYAIQPQMEEMRTYFLEWMQALYEEAATRNKFRNIPEPSFTPIKLQDAIKTGAMFAQLFKEGNISRTTRDEQAGIDLETEVELIADETSYIKEILPKDVPEMPYNIQVVPGAGLGTGQGRPPGAANKGGRPLGSTNVPVNNRRSGVKPPGQTPTSRVKVQAKSEEILTDEELIQQLNEYAEKHDIYITLDDILE